MSGIDVPIIALVISTGGLICTFVTLIITGQKTNKADSVDLEHRLTNIENELKYKLGPIWNAIEIEFPKLLIREDTP